MTSVTEQAIEAGARAIASRYDIIPGPLLEELPIIARAQWPILSAGLREACADHWGYQLRRESKFGREGSSCVCDVCNVMRAIQKIDEELGL